jgi:hypothetical protein
MEVNGQLHATAALPRGKDLRYQSDRRLGGPHGRFGGCREEKHSLASAWNQILAIKHVACRYIARAIPAPENSR